MNTHIAKLVAEIKEKAGWSDDQIASRVGVSQATINRVRNEKNGCNAKTYIAIVDLHKTVLSSHSHLTTP